MNLRFGTDGMRGVANAELTPELVLALGRAAARVLPAETFVLGRDTRRSGSMLLGALASGLAGEGADVIDMGVVPTPGVAWVAGVMGVPGAVVSASHNPFHDNGVKLFAAGGVKLPDATEELIELELEKILAGEERGPVPPTGHGVGTITSDPGHVTGYLEHLVGATDGRSLSGLRVVLDAANGAASSLGPEAFRRLGAEVIVMAASPDGTNINSQCGSTFPEALAAEVMATKSHVGLALDGDADRLLAVDETGVLQTGDELMALFAVDLLERGRLPGDTLVVTVMSNLGLRLAMAKRRIKVQETPVGDRYVLEAMQSGGFALGGEQSGHIVFGDMATTGDGLLTGILLCDLVIRRGKSFSELARGSMTRLPQRLVNVEVFDPAGVAQHREVVMVSEQVQAELGSAGRVLVRPSGTEPKLRVMVEATDPDAADKSVDRVVAVVRDVASRPAASDSGVRRDGDAPVHSVG